MKRIPVSFGIVLLVTAATAVGCTKDLSSATERTRTAEARKAPTPRYETLVVPAGTSVVALLQTQLSTDINRSGDAFVAKTTEPIVVDGRTLVSTGSRINGVLRDVQASGRIKDRAQMTLVFEEIIDSAGKVHAISAEPLTVKAASKTRDDVIKIAAGGIAGAIIGRISGKKSGTVIGAAAGATAGTILVLATKGEDMELNPGQRLNLQMTGPTRFVVLARR